jgi:FO synthase
VQEVIVQNFRAKPGTAMHACARAGRESSWRRSPPRGVVFGPRMHVQAPPEPVRSEQQLRLLDAGIDDWGGVSPLTPDHVNPSAVAGDRAPGRADRRAGTRAPGAPDDLPEFAAAPTVPARQDAGPVEALMGATGCAAPGDRRARSPWQDPDVSWKPRAIELTFAKGADAGLRADADGVRRDGHARADPGDGVGAGRAAAARTGRSARRCKAEAHRPITDDEALALFRAEGARWRRLCASPTTCGGGRRRRDHLRGEPQHQLHQRVLRRVPLLRVRPAARSTPSPTRSRSPRSPTARARRRWGATEVCMQGGIHPDLPGTFYFDLLDAVRERRRISTSTRSARWR